MMRELNLKSDGTAHQDVILNYLIENASESLAEKINNGTKTMNGCMDFIRKQAKMEAKNGCACIEDVVVFGWAVHYFEEDDIKEAEKKVEKTTKPEKKVEKVETPDEKLKRLIKEDKKKDKQDEMSKNQMTIFDFGFGG